MMRTVNVVALLVIFLALARAEDVDQNKMNPELEKKLDQQYADISASHEAKRQSDLRRAERQRLEMAAAAQVLSSATSLESQAATLRTQVHSFLSRVRAG